MKIQESAENYLERILMLQKSLGKVRAIDIVNDMNFTKASVSVALKNLRENNLVTVSENGSINLTCEGLKIAERVLEKHKTISQFFISIGVSEKQALEDACKIEHDISEESFTKLKEFLNKSK